MKLAALSCGMLAPCGLMEVDRHLRGRYNRAQSSYVDCGPKTQQNYAWVFTVCVLPSRTKVNGKN
jgi:hypothetical protein